MKKLLLSAICTIGLLVTGGCSDDKKAKKPTKVEPTKNEQPTALKGPSRVPEPPG